MVANSLLMPILVVVECAQRELEIGEKVTCEIDFLVDASQGSRSFPAVSAL